MSHEANNWKNDKTSKNTRGAVSTRHNESIPAKQKEREHIV